MIYTVAKPCDDVFWNEPDLPWHPHPFSYCNEVAQRDKAILRKVKKLLPKDGVDELMYYRVFVK